jgi:RimJ/RimL family protein N-acetyltransferase
MDVLLRLPSGLEIAVRPIRPGDKPLLAEGIRHQSAETIQRRFMSPKPRLTAAELRYLTEVDGFNHFALIAFESGKPQDRADGVVGVARFVRDASRPDRAEFAILICDAYQRRGAGRALGGLLVDAARARGIARFTAVTQSDNVPAQRLIAALGEQLEYVPAGAGAREVVVDLAA